MTRAVLPVDDNCWMAGRPLRDLGLASEGVLILSITRESGLVLGTPVPSTTIEVGDKLLSYGLNANLARLSTGDVQGLLSESTGSLWLKVLKVFRDSEVDGASLADHMTTAATLRAFLLDDLDQLREIHSRVVGAGINIDRMLTHGNAWSIYFQDPCSNRIECYVHTPWYVTQPHGHPFDLSKSNDEIMEMTEAHCRKDAGFMMAVDWEKKMAAKMGGAA